MGRHNIYLNDEDEQLAERLELSLSATLQAAIREEAQRRGVRNSAQPNRWHKEEGFNGITRGGGDGINRGWNGGRDW